MARACVLLADGFEEIEAITVIDVLRRAEIEVHTLGLAGREVRGAHGIPVIADRTVADGARETWDAVILPGGLPGATNLRDDAGVRDLVQRQNAAGRTVAAICAAPIVLGAAGVLEGRRATCYPGFEGELRGATHTTERVVADGNVVTSRGPGTALEFALALSERLAGAKTAAGLREGMLVAA